MYSSIKKVYFVCKKCGEGINGYVNIKDSEDTIECPYCYYENTLEDVEAGLIQ